MELLVCICTILVVYAALREDIKSVKPKARVSKPKVEEDGSGYIYILANPSFNNGLFKIGLTKRKIDTRMRELFTTGVPTPFVQCAVLTTGDRMGVEKQLHERFVSARVSPNREWFKLEQNDIEEILRGIDGIDYEVKSSNPRSITRALEGSW